jgi:hypothetical protein
MDDIPFAIWRADKYRDNDRQNLGDGRSTSDRVPHSSSGVVNRSVKPIPPGPEWVMLPVAARKPAWAVDIRIELIL